MTSTNKNFDCDFCKRTFSLKDEVTALAHKADDPFSTVLYGLRAYIDSELDAHLVTHEMEPGSVKERIALNDKAVEVIGRTLAGLTRDCKTHPDYEHGAYNTLALVGAYRGCSECLGALVRKARETPVFSAEDAAAVDKIGVQLSKGETMNRQANSCGCVKEDGNGVPCAAHGRANTFGELEATLKAVKLQVDEISKRLYKIGLMCDAVAGLQDGFCPDIGEPRDNLTRIKIALERFIEKPLGGP